MAESLGKTFDLLPLRSGKEIRSQQYSVEYKYVFSDESSIKIEIKKEEKDLDEPLPPEVGGFPSPILKLNFNDSTIHGKTKQERINITSLLIERVGIPLALHSDNISYWEREKFNGAYVEIYLDHKGMKVSNCYFRTGFYLDSGQLASIVLTSIYNITVEPYLTEYGAKHFALQKWNNSYTSATVEGFVIVQNKLMYHVWVSNCVNETIETDSGTYRSESINVQKYYVDVQNGNVTEGVGYATGGDRVKIDDDSSFLPAFTTPLLITATTTAAFIGKKERYL